VAGAWLTERGAERACLVDLTSEAVPIVMFGSATAGIPYIPLNYRLADTQLRALATRVVNSRAPASVKNRHPTRT